jgi:hypothetical protein
MVMTDGGKSDLYTQPSSWRSTWASAVRGRVSACRSTTERPLVSLFGLPPKDKACRASDAFRCGESSTRDTLHRECQRRQVLLACAAICCLNDSVSAREARESSPSDASGRQKFASRLPCMRVLGASQEIDCKDL